MSQISIPVRIRFRPAPGPRCSRSHRGRPSPRRGDRPRPRRYPVTLELAVATGVALLASARARPQQPGRCRRLRVRVARSRVHRARTRRSRLLRRDRCCARNGGPSRPTGAGGSGRNPRSLARPQPRVRGRGHGLRHRADVFRDDRVRHSARALARGLQVGRANAGPRSSPAGTSQRRCSPPRFGLSLSSFRSRGAS